MAMMLTALGLMSGTSLDGVDVALIETDGRRVKSIGPSGYRAYTNQERGLLRQALTEAVHLPQRDARPGILREAERAVTLAHAEAVAAVNAQHRISCQDIDIVGFHGQTVLHRPAQRMTVQIGDAAALARAIHIPVMHDFRAADVAAGGQGARSCRSTTARWRNRWSARVRSSWSISAAFPTSPISTGRIS
jgi:anhydro-N-acetylmuramic acid kinase